MIRIGKRGLAKRYGSPHTSFASQETGNVYLGYVGSPVDAYGEPSRPDSYLDDTGYYVVDIIVWRRDDPVRIASFLEEESLADPDNKILKEFAESFKRAKELFLAEEKAKKEVKETEKAIVALGGKETPQKESEKKGISELTEKNLQEEAKQAIQAVKEKEAIGIKDNRKERQIEELNEQLHKASQALKDLEEMKKKVAEQQEKEKELVARLEQSEQERFRLERSGPSINPPLVAIANPKDGMTVDSEYISLAGVAESGKGIAKFEILVNQQLAHRKDQKDLRLAAQDLRRMDFSEKIRLREGKNEISASCKMTKGWQPREASSFNSPRKKSSFGQSSSGSIDTRTFQP